MKRKIVTVILALSMVSALIGCGKTKEEKESSRIEKDIKEQFGDNISDQTAKEMADAIADVEDTEEYDGPVEEIEETPQEEGRHFDPLPEILNSTFNDGLIQVGDALFTVDGTASYEDVIATLDNSVLNGSYELKFDEDGNKYPYISYDDKISLVFLKNTYDSNGNRANVYSSDYYTLASIGLFNPSMYDTYNISMDSVYVAHGLSINSDFTIDELKELLNKDGFVEADDSNFKDLRSENKTYYECKYFDNIQRIGIRGKVPNSEFDNGTGSAYKITPCITLTFDMDGNNITGKYDRIWISNYDDDMDYFRLAE